MPIFSSKGQRSGWRPHNMSPLGRHSFLFIRRNRSRASDSAMHVSLPVSLSVCLSSVTFVHPA